MELYWLGLILGICSGISHYTGLIIEKLVINRVPSDAKLMKSLVKTPLWLFALTLRFGVGTVFFMIAQSIIGPALVPGLMACGLIILALGSIKIIGEKLNFIEMVAIVLMILAITLLGFSQLSIEIFSFDLINFEFLIRISVFTISLFIIAFIFQIFQKKSERYRAILIALISGLYFSLSNFWISPLMGVITHVFSGNFNIGELVLFIISSVILVFTNLFAISKMARALSYGQASKLVPIQAVPIQITPSIVYFFVFQEIPISLYSILFYLIAISFILISSFVLGKRQAQIDEIK